MTASPAGVPPMNEREAYDHMRSSGHGWGGAGFGSRSAVKAHEDDHAGGGVDHTHAAYDPNLDGTAYGPCEACGARYTLVRRVRCRRGGRFGSLWACEHGGCASAIRGIQREGFGMTWKHRDSELDRTCGTPLPITAVGGAKVCLRCEGEVYRVGVPSTGVR